MLILWILLLLLSLLHPLYPMHPSNILMTMRWHAYRNKLKFGKGNGHASVKEDPYTSQVNLVVRQPIMPVSIGLGRRLDDHQYHYNLHSYRKKHQACNLDPTM